MKDLRQKLNWGTDVFLPESFFSVLYEDINQSYFLNGFTIATNVCF